MKDISQRLASLSPERRQLLELQLKDKGIDLGRSLNLSRGDASLVEIKPQGIRPPLFFVHPVVGNVFSYFELAGRLHHDQPFLAFQSPGLDGSEPPLTRIEEMASRYLALLLERQPTGPYLLGGWSMGGIIAYEMARQLHVQNQQLALLVLLDSFALSSETELGGKGDLAHLEVFAHHLGLRLEEFTLPLDQILELDFDQQLAYILEVAKKAGIAPPGTGLDNFGNHFHVFKTNVKATNDYFPQEYAGRLNLLKAEEQTAKTREYPLMGWDTLAAGGIVVHTVPGNHYTMLRMPHLSILAAHIEASINQLQLPA